MKGNMPLRSVRAIDVAGRVPPHNADAEAAVLSAVLTDGAALDDVLDVISAEHFYSDANRRIFEATVELHASGQPVDIQTVAALLTDRERIRAVGGVAYIAKLLDATPAVAHVAAHARIVRDKARVRRMIETCQGASAEGYLPIDDAEAWLDRVAGSVCEAAADDKRTPVSLLYDLVRYEVQHLGQPMTGTSTGFRALDDQLGGGLHDGELVIVAARPGMGKTAFALALAGSVAAAGAGALFFSLEMPRAQIAQRLLVSESRVDMQRYRRGALGPEDTDRLIASANVLSQLPIWIDDTAAIGLAEVRAKVRRQQRAFNRDGADARRIGVVVVDYLQLMASDGENRETELARLSGGLKAIAKDLRVPVVALSQLNRAVEMRGGKDRRPTLADLRGSGAIEQDADAVLFIYRPEYYLTERESDAARAVRGYAEVIVAKQRNGPVGRVPLTFVEAFTRFENRSRDAGNAPHADNCRCEVCQ